VAEAERLQLDIHAFQAHVSEALRHDRAGNGQPPFAPGDRLAYLELKQQIRPVLEATIPPGATAAVVSRGDESLLELPGREAWHFPQEADGTYAGRHPASSEEAVSGLEELRARGAGYLVIPADDVWWLEHYEGFARHLAERAEALTHQGAPCLVFRLEAPGR
jgi:hypothetical protein